MRSFSHLTYELLDKIFDKEMDLGLLNIVTNRVNGLMGKTGNTAQSVAEVTESWTGVNNMLRHLQTAVSQGQRFIITVELEAVKQEWTIVSWS